MKTKGAMQELLRRPIAYHVVVAKAFGSIQLAILWSQFYYWSDKTDVEANGWIYKTSDEIFAETALKRRGQETARKMGVKLGVLEEDRRGMPATMHFRVNMERSMELIEEYTGKNKTKKKTSSKRVSTKKRAKAPVKVKKEKKEFITKTDGGELNKVMEHFQSVNPSYERLYAQKTQRTALDRLVQKWGAEQVESIIAFLTIANGNKYSGINITTPCQLERDLGKLKAWGDKMKQNAKAKKVLI